MLVKVDDVIASDLLFLNVVIFRIPFRKPFSRFLLMSERIEGVAEFGGEKSDSIEARVGGGRSLEDDDDAGAVE